MPTLSAGRMDLSGMCVFLETRTPETVALIERHGARLADAYSARCTHVIQQYQGNELFSSAVAAGQQLATMRWLARFLELHVMSDPGECVLDFPAPAEAVPGAAELVISTTGFDKQATRDLGDLVVIIGARYERALTRDATHLIAATCAVFCFS